MGVGEKILGLLTQGEKYPGLHGSSKGGQVML